MATDVLLAPKICVVGAGNRFLSGISYHTNRLSNELAKHYGVSTILMRQLLPTFLYPGRKRVGQSLTTLSYGRSTPVFDGVDWYWIPSIFRAAAFLIRQRPQIVIFEWWTGTVLHTYILLSLVARLLNTKIIIEFHEVLDTGEASLWYARFYVRVLVPLLLRLVHGFVVHSEYDRQLMQSNYDLNKRPVSLVSIGSFDHYQSSGKYREAPEDCRNILFFGVIRPYKGLEDLIEAFNAIPQSEIHNYWLTVVGELWEGWTLPLERIAQSPYRDRITLVNRYVRDEEVASHFRGADIIALPYHRSSASGPLHVSMSWGLPLVVTNVGGLVEAAKDYEGAVFVPAHDPAALMQGLQRASTLVGNRYKDPHSWNRTLEVYGKLFQALLDRSPSTSERLKS